MNKNRVSTSLTSWMPRSMGDFGLKPMDNFKHQLNSLFDDFFRSSSITSKAIGSFSPSMEISEDKNAYMVKAEIPGMSERDVKISLQNNILTISGEKKQEKEEHKNNAYYSETRYGSFLRSIQLENEINKAQIKSEFKNGVLRLTIPKRKSGLSKPVNIKIKKG